MDIPNDCLFWEAIEYPDTIFTLAVESLSYLLVASIDEIPEQALDGFYPNEVKSLTYPFDAHNQSRIP